MTAKRESTCHTCNSPNPRETILQTGPKKYQLAVYFNQAHSSPEPGKAIAKQLGLRSPAQVGHSWEPHRAFLAISFLVGGRRQVSEGSNKNPNPKTRGHSMPTLSFQKKKKKKKKKKKRNDCNASIHLADERPKSNLTSREWK